MKSLILPLVTGWVSFGLALSVSAVEVEIEPDIVYGHKDGLALTLDWFHPTEKSNGGAVVFIVSGGWYSRWAPPEQTQGWVQPYLESGFECFAVRHGSSPRYGIPDAVSDVRRSIRFIRSEAERFGIDADRIGTLGMSAGGHLSLMLGTTGDDGDPDASDPLERVSSRIKTCVALVPPTDLTVAVWEAPESLPAYKNFPALNLDLESAAVHSPLKNVSCDDASALVVMGSKDDLVPQRHGEWIAAEFEKIGVRHRLIIEPESGHDLGPNSTRNRVLGEVKEWFEEELRIKN